MDGRPAPIPRVHNGCSAVMRAAVLGMAGLCALAGCAGVPAQQTAGEGPIAPAFFTGEQPLLPDTSPQVALPPLKLPPLKLPPLKLPGVDLPPLAPGGGPSNDRDWVPEHRVLASAEREGSLLHVRNVRNCEFYSYVDCLVDHYDKTYDLSKLQTVDFIMIPFNETPALAHTMLSFGFEGGDYLGVSVEVRLEQGESYSPTLGLFGQFELIYVVADERDLIRVRTEHRNVDVLVYRAKVTPEMAQRLLLDIMQRVNKLHDEPEYYDTLTNNCTTNIVRHINYLAPGRVPSDYRVLLPGYADNLAYDLGLLDNTVPFTELRRRARVNDLALRYKDDPQFSQRIRQTRVLR
jgi:hypothetical protein